MYSMIDVEKRVVLFCVLQNRDLLVTLLNRTRFMQLLLSNSVAKAYMIWEMNVPTTFKADFYFDAFSLASGEIDKEL